MLEIKPDSQLLTARWVLPVVGNAIQDGAVIFGNGAIEAVCPQSTLADLLGPETLLKLSYRRKDYGNAVIMPGFINLHTHLDYSLLPGLDGQCGQFAWMKDLVGRASYWSADQWFQSARYGAEQAALSGTTCVVDSSFTGNSAKALAEVGLRGIVGLELFGSNEELAEPIWSQWRQRLQTFVDGANGAARSSLAQNLIQLTVAPHSPYLVSPRLWQRATEWANSEKLPLMAHVAESAQECQWIESGNEEVDDYLRFITRLFAEGATSLKSYQYLRSERDRSWRGLGLSPVGHLHKHRLLNEKLLAVHAVHVNDEDIALLARNHVSIVHCPRSNSYLGNGLLPLAKMRAAELAVGFGTDSLASCDDLDVWQEFRYARAMHRAELPDFHFSDAEGIFSVTLGAAQMIGLDQQIGSLQAGKRADIAVFQNEERELLEPLTIFFHGRSRLCDLFVDGKCVVEGRSLVGGSQELER